MTADGVAHDVDVIIYGTGFTASKFLTPMTVKGRGGRDLHEQWDGEARAYLGVTVPGFPNLFCLYGPNTNIVINGSIIYFSECGVRYILGLLGMALGRGRRARRGAARGARRVQRRVDAENARMAWGVSDVNSWYKNASGRVVPELALHPARVLAAHQGPRPGRLHPHLTPDPERVSPARFGRWSDRICGGNPDSGGLSPLVRWGGPGAR